MRPDLQDALGPVYWAEAQIPVFNERFISWQRGYPYELVMEPDPDDANWEFLTAYLRKPLDQLIIGDVGAIINSCRTALDIFWMRLVTRYGRKPKGNTGFPIRASATDFNEAVDVLKSEYGCTDAEVTSVKRCKAYRGTNKTLYALHHLDIKRKHHSLLVLEPAVEASQITLLNGFSYAHRLDMQDKTILYRIPAGRFRPHKGNTLLSAEIFLNEPALLVTKQPANLTLLTFAAAVRGIIENCP